MSVATAWSALALLLVVVFGAVLESVVGQQFLMNGARAYRATAREFAPVLALFALILVVLLQTLGDFERRFPTKLVRIVFVVPMTAAFLVGLLVLAPLGWAAAAGWMVGETVTSVQARVTEVDGPKDYGRRCRHHARIEVSGSDARICVQGLVVGDNPAVGDAVLLAGKQSSFGLYVHSVAKTGR